MADSYSKWVMTTAFANNSQAALNSGGKIEWVSLKTSDDAHQVSDLDGFNDTTLATANIKQISGISSVTISGNTVTITGLFNSTNNASDYYIRTIFLVAKYNGKEFLAGTTVANTSGSAFRMPASSDTEITEFTARPQISVTNTNSISTTVDPVASATNERVDSLEATLQGEIDDINVDKQNLWNKLADYVTKAAAETITGVKTFSQTIVGSITGNAGTATKLQTERTIGFSGDVNGTAQSFDGSKNITLPINLNSINQNNTTSTQSAGYNSPVTIIDGITRDTKGRVTGVNTKTVTLPPVQTTISGNAASATKLEIARLIGGVSFDGTSDIILPGVNSIGNQNTTGNAATATNADVAKKAVALQTPRKINGTVFDGTADINILASNNDDLVHKSADENIGGKKTFTDDTTFNKAINGALKSREAIFTDFASVAADTRTYAGFWFTMDNKPINGPFGDTSWSVIEVAVGNTYTTGTIKLTKIINGETWITTANGGFLTAWHKFSTDDTVIHNFGDETAAGFKKFSGNIATTSDNSMINGGGNNGDIAMVKTLGSPGFLAIGNFNQRLIVRQSNNASISPSDTFADIFTVDINGVVKAGTQQDLVPLDKSVVHNAGNETVGGDKNFSGNNNFSGSNTFLNQINGSLASRRVTFTDFADVAKNSVKYSGIWYKSKDDTIANSPIDVEYAIIEVVVGDNSGSGKIIFTPFSGGNVGKIYYNVFYGIALNSWHQFSDDDTVVHNTGDETVNGKKTFTSAINASLNGNASSATKLQTTRNINGVGFDGTSDINILASNNDDLVHKGADETIPSNKNFTGDNTFTKLINGALNSTRLVPFADFSDVANGNMIKYAGLWFNQVTNIQNTPTGGDVYWSSIEVLPTTSSSGFIKVTYQITGDVYITGVDQYKIKGWYKVANDANLVHTTGDETIGGNNTFTGNNTLNGVTTVNALVTKNIERASMIASFASGVHIEFAETATGVSVYVYGIANGLQADTQWHDLQGTLPSNITPPNVTTVIESTQVAGIAGVTLRTASIVKIAIHVDGTMSYIISHSRSDDNSTRYIDIEIGMSGNWLK